MKIFLLGATAIISYLITVNASFATNVGISVFMFLVFLISYIVPVLDIGNMIGSATTGEPIPTPYYPIRLGCGWFLGAFVGYVIAYSEFRTMLVDLFIP